MKLKKDFVVHNSNGEALLVPLGGAEFSGLVRGNRTLGAMLEILKGNCSRQELIDAMKERFDAPEGAIERDVDSALSKLREIGALDD